MSTRGESGGWVFKLTAWRERGCMSIVVRSAGVRAGSARDLRWFVCWLRGLYMHAYA